MLRRSLLNSKNSSKKFRSTRNEAYTNAGNVYRYTYGKIVWLSGWIKLRSDVALRQTDKIVTGLPEASENVNIIYYDQTNNSFGCLYIAVDFDRTSIVTSVYSQTNHLGGILNFASVYTMS